MMNNKYLAIVLAVAAVLIVVYQVAFNKKKPRRQTQQKPLITQPAQPQSQPQTQPQGQPAPAATPPTVARSSRKAAPVEAPRKPHEGLQIDYNSPILLTRVTDNPIEPYPKEELPQQFGATIFSKPQSVEEIVSTGTPEEKEVRFKLNSIVIDKKRRLALINDTIVKVGDFISGAQVMNIQKSHVLLKFRDQTILLSTTSRIKKITYVGGTGEN